MSFTLQNCFLSFVLLNFATTINAVPVTVVDVLNSTSTNETIPDPVNINGSVAVLDTTLPSVESTTTVDIVNCRNARSEEEPIKLSSELPIDQDQEKNKSSAIQFPKDDVIEISGDITNTTASSSTPVEPVIKVAIGIISSNSSAADSEIRDGRSQSETVEGETNVDLTQTLAALTTLSSIINQTSINDSLSTVI